MVHLTDAPAGPLWVKPAVNSPPFDLRARIWSVFSGIERLYKGCAPFADAAVVSILGFVGILTLFVARGPGIRIGFRVWKGSTMRVHGFWHLLLSGPLKHIDLHLILSRG